MGLVGRLTFFSTPKSPPPPRPPDGIGRLQRRRRIAFECEATTGPNSQTAEHELSRSSSTTRRLRSLLSSFSGLDVAVPARGGRDCCPEEEENATVVLSVETESPDCEEHPAEEAGEEEGEGGPLPLAASAAIVEPMMPGTISPPTRRPGAKWPGFLINRYA